MTGNDSAVALRRLLVDEGASPSYSDSRLVDYLNDATVAILNNKPNALVTNINLVVEDYDEPLPNSVIWVHDVPFNGTVSSPGKAIRRVHKADLDQFDPGWRATAVSQDHFEHFMYEETEPKRIEFYPRVSSPVTVTATVTEIPEGISSLNDTLPLSDDFFDAYLNYAAYRIFDEDSDEPGNFSRADKFYQRFAEGLGIKLQNRITFSPNQKGA